MTTALSPKFPLGDLTAKEFLGKYWQKKPLLVRKAFSPFPRFLSPDELAGLACEKEMMSRIILEKGGKKPWEVRRGPFNSRAFRSLPKKHWTLLVNGVDRRIPEINRLLDSFNFIPNWRIDDVMISYAVDRGNVGAHVDNFDVFLIQAEGTREWQIHTNPVLDDDFVPDLDVRLLRSFKPNRTWVLEPGDMLYLPPRVPHHGIARGNGCMTYSVGFRAPSHCELFEAISSYVLTTMDEQVRYTDPDLKLGHPGLLSPAVVRRLRETLIREIPSGDELTSWFGRYVTEPKEEAGEIALDPPTSVKELRRRLIEECFLVRAEGCRIAFSPRSDRTISLFINGGEQIVDASLTPLIKLISGSIVIPARKVHDALRGRIAEEMLCMLVNEGSFYFPPDPEDDDGQ